METEARTLVEKAMSETGWSLEEIADRIDYKSLKRAMAGEIALPESRRIHLNDLILLRRAYGPKVGDLDQVQAQFLDSQNISKCSMPPPHVEASARTREDPPVSKTVPSHNEYSEAIQIIGRLMDRSPENFRAALAMLRGMEQHTK